MSSSAREVEFGELLAEPLRNGLTRPKRVRGEGVPMVNMGELFAHRRIGDVEMERVPLNERNPERDVLQPLDLIFARQSIVAEGAGKAAIFLGAPEPVTFESHLIRARVDPEKADPMWLFYFFESPDGRQRIRSIVNQVSAAGIRGTDLRALSVPCPDPPLQRRSAAVLKAFDDKIDSNRRLDRLLGDAAAAVFRSRFVDFVGVEEFEESEIGPIPRGWQVRRFSEAVEINPRVPLRKGTVAPFIEMAAVERWGMRPTKIAARPYAGGARFEPGDTLMARITGSIEHGKGAFVDFLAQPGAGSTEFLVLRAKPPLTAEATFLLSREDRVRSHAIASMTGSSGRQRVPVTAFDDILIALPPDCDSWRGEAEFLRAVFAQSRIRWAESQTLAEVRDALLPELIAGRIRVPDTDDTAEAVAAAVGAVPA
jgi:type I restriction enzyme, S subunit